MTPNATMLTQEQFSSWQTNGYFRVSSFATAEVCDAMRARVIELSRLAAAGHDISPTFVMPEANLRGREAAPEALLSKMFKLHRDTVFHEFAIDRRVTDLLVDIIGDDLDCFLSQFIFKNPGAWGQPWHQDSYYFPFEPARPIAGVWLAVTEATLENGCLHVVPGSHHEPIHEHIPDRRPNANLGYVEIVDHDMSTEVAVLMQPGDLLVFDSHLMHRSTDNVSDGIRAAMVYHYCTAGTIDLKGSVTTDFQVARRR